VEPWEQLVDLLLVLVVWLVLGLEVQADQVWLGCSTRKQELTNWLKPQQERVSNVHCLG
jgi:hypothetical protein